MDLMCGTFQAAALLQSEYEGRVLKRERSTCIVDEQTANDEQYEQQPQQ
jgi:hypothetical protein